ncbi:hypothetical protein BDC45DRAFT_608574 [Circinella umbellata]|nr:hypothetical protein BDC45DRAFT_608574 [Circinella umbellata]
MTNRDDTYMNALLKRSNTARNNSMTTTRLMSPLTQRPKLSKDNCNSKDNNNNNSCSLLTQTRVQKRKKEYCLDEWAAIYGESPINLLSVDCLYNIFEYCNNIKTLSIISNVCKRWRDIVLDPILWRNLLEKWDSFLDTLYIINQHPMHSIQRQLLFTRTIRMLEHSHNTINRKNKRRNNMTPTIQQSLANNNSCLLKNVTRLIMARMYFDDIVDLVRYTPSLQVLRCDKIRTNGRYMMFHFFADLHKLQVLDLRFRESCEHTNYAFTLSDRRTRRTLPTTLKEFRMTGVYDREEIQSLLSLPNNNPLQIQHNQMIGLQQQQQQQQQPRRQQVRRLTRQIDDTLVERYQSLCFLVNLKSLCLGRCNAYTARVWRECIKPCVSNLEHLSLSGWRTSQKNTQETELAIQEMIQELKKIKLMELLDFECNRGVVNGIKQLDYVSIEASFDDDIHSNNKNNCILQIVSTPDILLKRKVHICKINF